MFECNMGEIIKLLAETNGRSLQEKLTVYNDEINFIHKVLDFCIKLLLHLLLSVCEELNTAMFAFLSACAD